MPGRQAAVHAGLEFRVSPNFWLRRLTHFPFYFESHNPSFRIDVKRVSEPRADERWPEGEIAFEVVFANNISTVRQYEVPNLEVGQSHHGVIGEIYTAFPGQTIITIPTRPQMPFSAQPAEFKTLYSYQVRTEEQLWLGLLGLFLAIVTAIGSTAPGWLKLVE